MSEFSLGQVGPVVGSWTRTWKITPLKKALSQRRGDSNRRAALLDTEVEGGCCQGLAGGEALQEEPLKMLHKKKNQPPKYATLGSYHCCSDFLGGSQIAIHCDS